MSQAAIDRFVKGHPLPSTMGACADEYKAVRDVRLAMEKEAQAVKDRENELKEYMIANLSKSAQEGGDSGAAGRFYRVQVTTAEKITVTDWPSLHAYIQRTGRFDLLQKRLGETAAADTVEKDGAMLPGCERIVVPDISVTKIPGR